MGNFNRRIFILCLPATLAFRLGAAVDATVRGRLIQNAGAAPSIKTPAGAVVLLEGDEATVGVLRDRRLAADDFEAAGSFLEPARFRVAPIHTRAMFVYRGGRRLVLTYWCEKCAIRTYTPGICMCCQEETALDPRDPSLKDADPSKA